MFGQLFQAGDLRIALTLLSFFFCARFFLGLLAALPFHRDSRFGTLFDSLALLSLRRHARIRLLFDTFTLGRLIRSFARCDLPRPCFRKRFLLGRLARFTFSVKLLLAFAI